MMDFEAGILWLLILSLFSINLKLIYGHYSKM